VSRNGSRRIGGITADSGDAVAAVPFEDIVVFYSATQHRARARSETNKRFFYFDLHF